MVKPSETFVPALCPLIKVLDIHSALAEDAKGRMARENL
jgi:hypothetical protein